MEYSEAESAVMLHCVQRPPGELGYVDLQPAVVRADRGDTVLRRVPELPAASQSRNQSLFEDAVLAIFQSTPDGELVAVNSAFAQMFGFRCPAEVEASVHDIGRDLFVHPEQCVEITQLVSKQRVGRGFDVPYCRKDGSLFVGNLHIWTVRDTEHRVLWLEGCIEDITERKAMEDRLYFLSTHDALTGLYNRWYFEQEMERLGRGRRYPTSILLADIDDLKLVNDREGHSAGDQRLRQAARVLLAGCRSDDVVARMGGDEFAVLFPHTDASAVQAVVSRLRYNLITVNSNQIGSPLGMAFGVATAGPGEVLIDVLGRADQRMYQDKARRSESRQS